MTTPAPARDGAVDLVRALCIAGVVVLHSLMVGVTIGSDGPVFANAGETGSWLVPVSWVLQVMPLFFVIGGFAGITALRRSRRSAENGAFFAAGRVRRLLVPAVVAVGVAGVLLALLGDAGVSPAVVDIAGYRFGQPLWFLGVFLLCQALLPGMARLHESAPLQTIVALFVCALVVDVARTVTGAAGIGFLNLAFVWLAMQQLGFLLADGWIDRLSRSVRGAGVVTALALLGVSFALGFHSPDLVANINPPTTALVLVGIIHTGAFSLLRGRLAAVAAHPGWTRFTRFVSARAMTIYLWHMPVLLTLAGFTALGALGTDSALPAPASADWWLTRPLWLAVALGATALVAMPLSRLETLSIRPVVVRPGGTTAAVILGIGSVVLLLVAGTSPTTALVAVGGWLLALRLVTPTGRASMTGTSPSLVPVAQPKYSAWCSAQPGLNRAPHSGHASLTRYRAIVSVVAHGSSYHDRSPSCSAPANAHQRAIPRATSASPTSSAWRIVITRRGRVARGPRRTPRARSASRTWSANPPITGIIAIVSETVSATGAGSIPNRRSGPSARLRTSNRAPIRVVAVSSSASSSSVTTRPVFTTASAGEVNSHSAPPSTRISQRRRHHDSTSARGGRPPITKSMDAAARAAAVPGTPMGASDSARADAVITHSFTSARIRCRMPAPGR